MSKIPTVGNWVRLTEIHPKMKERLEHFFADPRIKGKVSVSSGCRTYQQQAELYRRYRAGTGNLAANPDRRFGPSNKWRGSYHMTQEDGFAYAVDFRNLGGISTSDINSIAAEYGLARTVKIEWWHHQAFGHVGGGKLGWFPAPAMKGKEDKSLTKAKPLPPPPIIAKTMPIIRKNSRGEHVKVLQKKLTDLGFRVSKHPKKSGIDGIAGRMTIAAVKRFQKSRGLTIDGVVGKNTYKALGIIK